MEWALDYKFKLYGVIKSFFYLIESCSSGKRLRIVLKHKQSSKCAIDAGIPQNFLSNILCFEWANEG